MRFFKAFSALILIGLLAVPAIAQEGGTPLMIGKDLKVGMPLQDVFAKLGIPKSIHVNRGTEPENDSIAVEYPSHGVVVHAMSRKGTLEEIEVLPNFKGSFTEGLRLGAKFSDLIGKYGMPNSLSSQVARYPDSGMYFVLEKEILVSAKVFAKGSRILDLQLMNRK